MESGGSHFCSSTNVQKKKSSKFFMLFMDGIYERADFLLSPMHLSLSSCQFLCTMKTYTT